MKRKNAIWIVLGTVVAILLLFVEMFPLVGTTSPPGSRKGNMVVPVGYNMASTVVHYFYFKE